MMDNQEILLQIGGIIRQARKEQDLTLLELEVRSGVNEGDISKIENGKKSLEFITLVKLARGLELPLYKLLKDFKY